MGALGAAVDQCGLGLPDLRHRRRQLAGVCGTGLGRLVGVALIHAQAITEKRGSLRAWTILLSIFAFSFSLLGTFLVRSGVLTSVHAFASDPKRGVFILAFLAIVVGGSLLLYALRAPKVLGGRAFALVSRETAILIANLMFATAAAMVMLGTLFPLIGDALNLGRISVGPPYFGFLFPLLMLPVVLLLPFGPFLRWGKGDPAVFKQIGSRAGIAAVACAVAAWFLSGQWKAVAGTGALVWICIGVLLYVVRRWREMPRGRRYPLEMSGMLLAHFGVGIFIAGVLLSEALSVERDVRMAPGQTETIGAYAFRFDGAKHTTGPNWVADQGTVTVSKNGNTVTVLHPQKRTYERGQVQTESAVDPGFTRDLYVALGEPLDGGAWGLRVYYKPFIRWIWGGGLLMMLGGVCAAADRRFRSGKAVVAADDAVVAPRPAEAHP
jgi:cytochrome c-type biogenesis protein CcmF